jgi:murein DD-endopeptidase MepM/ murein hydrolase activator NlpD
MSHRALTGVLALLLAGGGVGALPAAPSRPAVVDDPAGAPVDYRPPVPAPVRVVLAVRPPAGPYGAGHRGVDLATHPGEPVRAAGAGVVRFAGDVAGRGVVVIAHADGVSPEYEPLAPSVRAGQAVARGQPIGTVSGTHRDCDPGRCLHWAARRDGAYLDPMTLLAPLGPVRLLPW